MYFSLTVFSLLVAINSSVWAADTSLRMQENSQKSHKANKSTFQDEKVSNDDRRHGLNKRPSVKNFIRKNSRPTQSQNPGTNFAAGENGFLNKKLIKTNSQKKIPKPPPTITKHKSTLDWSHSDIDNSRSVIESPPKNSDKPRQQILVTFKPNLNEDNPGSSFNISKKTLVAPPEDVAPPENDEECTVTHDASNQVRYEYYENLENLSQDSFSVPFSSAQYTGTIRNTQKSAIFFDLLVDQLFKAASGGDLFAVEKIYLILLRFNYDVSSIKNDNGPIPPNLAQLNGYQRMADFIRQNYEKIFQDKTKKVEQKIKDLKKIIDENDPDRQAIQKENLKINYNLILGYNIFPSGNPITDVNFPYSIFQQLITNQEKVKLNLTEAANEPDIEKYKSMYLYKLYLAKLSDDKQSNNNLILKSQKKLIRDFLTSLPSQDVWPESIKSTIKKKLSPKKATAIKNIFQFDNIASFEILFTNQMNEAQHKLQQEQIYLLNMIFDDKEKSSTSKLEQAKNILDADAHNQDNNMSQLNFMKNEVQLNSDAVSKLAAIQKLMKKKVKENLTLHDATILGNSESNVSGEASGKQIHDQTISAFKAFTKYAKNQREFLLGKELALHLNTPYEQKLSWTKLWNRFDEKMSSTFDWEKFAPKNGPCFRTAVMDIFNRLEKNEEATGIYKAKFSEEPLCFETIWRLFNTEKLMTSPSEKITGQPLKDANKSSFNIALNADENLIHALYPDSFYFLGQQRMLLQFALTDNNWDFFDKKKLLQALLFFTQLSDDLHLDMPLFEGDEKFSHLF